MIHQSFKYLFTDSSHVKFGRPLPLFLLPHYEFVPPRVFVIYVQTISSDVVRASTQLVPPLASHVCHRSGPDLFLCGHKSIVACASQLCLVVGHVAS
jgi:hypothetical protein